MRVLSVMAAVVLLGGGAAWAQTSSVEKPLLNPDRYAVPASKPGPAPDWGTTAVSAVSVAALECSTFSESAAWAAVGGSPNRYLTGGDEFECTVHLPTGASVKAIEVEACDNSSTGYVLASFDHTTTGGGGGTTLASVSTGDTAIPGCGFFHTVLTTPFTIDNSLEKYWFEIINTTSDGSTYVAGARVYYSLQVSPAPSTATFTDVPTSSPFFKYVEALYASGLINGCGGGNYCPSNPVTRGQLAVFLAGALGMHWADYY